MSDIEDYFEDDEYLYWDEEPVDGVVSWPISEQLVIYISDQ